jgi:hypothetical protein
MPNAATLTLQIRTSQPMRLSHNLKLPPAIVKYSMVSGAGANFSAENIVGPRSIGQYEGNDEERSDKDETHALGRRRCIPD